MTPEEGTNSKQVYVLDFSYTMKKRQYRSGLQILAHRLTAAGPQVSVKTVELSNKEGLKFGRQVVGPYTIEFEFNSAKVVVVVLLTVLPGTVVVTGTSRTRPASVVVVVVVVVTTGVKHEQACERTETEWPLKSRCYVYSVHRIYRKE